MRRTIRRGSTWECPNCRSKFRMTPYDIGSGPEVACPTCEWCWGAEGQDLKPLARPVGNNSLTLFFDRDPQQE